MLWHVFLGAIRLPPTFEALSLTCANVLKLKKGVHPCEYCYQPHNERLLYVMQYIPFRQTTTQNYYICWKLETVKY